MSTRCNIIIKDRGDRRIYLYHHHDGYPEGVGSERLSVRLRLRRDGYERRSAWRGLSRSA